MASTGHWLTTSVEIVGVVTKVSTIAVHIASPVIENMTSWLHHSKHILDYIIWNYQLQDDIIITRLITSFLHSHLHFLQCAWHGLAKWPEVYRSSAVRPGSSDCTSWMPPEHRPCTWTPPPLHPAPPWQPFPGSPPPHIAPVLDTQTMVCIK